MVRENEQFAATFLRSTYENNPGFRVEQSEVYNKYLSACAKAGRKGVIAPHHFPKCVRFVALFSSTYLLMSLGTVFNFFCLFYLELCLE